MKARLFYILLFPIAHLFAATFNCEYQEFRLSIVADNFNDVSLSVLKENTEINHCTFQVIEYNDGKKSASLSEIVRYQKISCDKHTEALEISDKGFIKISPGGDYAHAMIIKNNQPLLCKKSNKS